MRQQAWLWAEPRPKDPKPGEAAKERISRLAELKRLKVAPQWPPCSLPFLIERFHEIGPIETAGGERAPLSWSEIRDWQEDNGIRLPPWQAKLMRRLSKDFIAQLVKSEDPDCPPPFGERITVDLLIAVDLELEMVLDRMARRGRK